VLTYGGRKRLLANPLYGYNTQLSDNSEHDSSFSANNFDFPEAVSQTSQLADDVSTALNSAHSTRISDCPNSLEYFSTRGFSPDTRDTDDFVNFVQNLQAARTRDDTSNNFKRIKIESSSDCDWSCDGEYAYSTADIPSLSDVQRFSQNASSLALEVQSVLPKSPLSDWSNLDLSTEPSVLLVESPALREPLGMPYYFGQQLEVSQELQTPSVGTRWEGGVSGVDLSMEQSFERDYDYGDYLSNEVQVSENSFDNLGRNFNVKYLYIFIRGICRQSLSFLCRCNWLLLPS